LRDISDGQESARINAFRYVCTPPIASVLSLVRSAIAKLINFHVSLIIRLKNRKKLFPALLSNLAFAEPVSSSCGRLHHAAVGEAAVACIFLKTSGERVVAATASA